MELVKEKDVLINRTQMLQIVREYNIFVSIGTIHRWANEPDFPRVVGKKGKFLLYAKTNFISYLIGKREKTQDDH
jgi:hypothetical protein